MDFLTVTEIAKYIGMSRQKTTDKAKRENWQGRKRQAKGGGTEYCVATLPEPIRQAIEKKQVFELTAQVRQQQEAELSGSLKALPEPTKAKKSRANPKGLPTVHRPEDTQLALNLDDPNEAVKRLTFKDRECADARLAIVLDILAIGDTHKYSQKQAIAFFLEQMREGVLPERIAQLIPTANARSNNKREVSARTLLSWVVQFKAANANTNARLLALAPKKTKFERSYLQETWLPHFLKIHAVPSKPKLKHSYAKFAQQWRKDGRAENELPSLDQVRRVWRKMPAIVREKGRRHGADYRQLLPYIERLWHELRPNDVWIIDGHSFKAKVQHFEHGQPFVPEITVVIDGCTRKIVGFSIALAESSKAVGDAIRFALRYCGLPVLIYSDNGKGETGRDITGELTGICPRLGINHQVGMPGNPQGRGIIERWWQNTLIAQAREYPTFHGKGMDGTTAHKVYRKMESWAKAERDGKLLTDEQQKHKKDTPTWERFFNDLLQTIEQYNQRPHSNHPKNPDTGQNYSPSEYWDFRMAQLADDDRPAIIDEDELKLLERSMKEATTTRGIVRFNKQRYFNVELAKYSGEKILIAYDWDKPQDIDIFHLDGHFICTAQLNGNARLPFANVDSMRETQKKQRAANQIKRLKNKAKRIEMDIKGGNVIENTPDFAQLVAPNMPANDVIVPKEVEILDVEVVETPPKRSKYAF